MAVCKENQIDTTEAKMAPLFVLGCPRSGTTLLGGLLAESRWGPAVETHFILKYAEAGEQVDYRSRSEVSGLVRRVIAERPIRQWGIQWDIDSFLDSESPQCYAELVASICMARTTKLGFLRWSDKTPHYCDSAEKIQKLRRLFPAAKFLFVVRDGRDVANSLLQKPWGPNNIWQCAAYWKKCCEVIQGAAGQLGMQSHTVLFENLLRNPEDELTRIFRFLNCEDVSGKVAKYVEKMDVSKTGQWESSLRPSQIKVFEEAVGDTLQEWGYSTTHAQREGGSFKQLAYQLHDKAKWAQFMFNQNIIDGFRIRVLGKQPFAE